MGAVAGGLIGAGLAAADVTVTAHFLVAAATVGALNLTTLGLVRCPGSLRHRLHCDACAGGTRARSSPSRRWASPRRCWKARRSSGARSTSPTNCTWRQVSRPPRRSRSPSEWSWPGSSGPSRRPLRSAGRPAVRRGRGPWLAFLAALDRRQCRCRDSRPGSSSAPASRRHTQRSSSPPAARRVSPRRRHRRGRGEWAAAASLGPVSLALADRYSLRTARAAELAVDSREPQYLGVLGALQVELAMREGDVAGGRAAVDEALDRIEFCSDDALRMAMVSAAGLEAEAGAAQHARDLGDERGGRGGAHPRRAAGRPGAGVRRGRRAARAGLPRERGGGQLPRRRAGRPGALRGRRPRMGGARPPVPRGARAVAAGGGARGRGRPRGGRRPGPRRARDHRAARRHVARRRAREPGRARPAAGARRRERRRRGGRRRAVRPDAARAAGARARGRGGDEPRDRQAALHGGEDRQRARVADPRQARRALPHRGGGRRAPARARRASA